MSQIEEYVKKLSGNVYVALDFFINIQMYMYCKDRLRGAVPPFDDNRYYLDAICCLAYEYMDLYGDYRNRNAIQINFYNMLVMKMPKPINHDVYKVYGLPCKYVVNKVPRMSRLRNCKQLHEFVCSEGLGEVYRYVIMGVNKIDCMYKSYKVPVVLSLGIPKNYKSEVLKLKREIEENVGMMYKDLVANCEDMREKISKLGVSLVVLNNDETFHDKMYDIYWQYHRKARCYFEKINELESEIEYYGECVPYSDFYINVYGKVDDIKK